MLASLRHPNICLYMAACIEPPNRAIVTELVSRGSLWEVLRTPNLFEVLTLHKYFFNLIFTCYYLCLFPSAYLWVTFTPFLFHPSVPSYSHTYSFFHSFSTWFAPPLRLTLFFSHPIPHSSIHHFTFSNTIPLTSYSSPIHHLIVSSNTSPFSSHFSLIHPSLHPILYHICYRAIRRLYRTLTHLTATVYWRTSGLRGLYGGYWMILYAV